MALDFQQINEQVREMGENAPAREHRLKELRKLARQQLKRDALELDRLRDKVRKTVQLYDPSLRCALPVEEPLDSHFPQPEMPETVTILAADGSQIALDRHSEVEYCLINVGAFQMACGSPDQPETFVKSRIMYADELYTEWGVITEATLALRRDLGERTMLAELAEQAVFPAAIPAVTPAATPAGTNLPGFPGTNSKIPVVSFTDGPMELWGAKDSKGEAGTEFKESLRAYQEALSRLHKLGAITAGYVDKPGANLVIRLLEVAMASEEELPEIRKCHPLRGVRDGDLYRDLLGAGERSPVYAMQSQSARSYAGPLALHFFYLNVGRPGSFDLARVEIPAWVAENSTMLDHLHAVLVRQCRIMGARPFPYALHRAHETAVVSLQEKEQVTQMITLELRRRGVPVAGRSHKQAAKDNPGRTRYEG